MRNGWRKIGLVVAIMGGFLFLGNAYAQEEPFFPLGLYMDRAAEDDLTLHFSP